MVILVQGLPVHCTVQSEDTVLYSVCTVYAVCTLQSVYIELYSVCTLSFCQWIQLLHIIINKIIILSLNCPECVEEHLT